VTKHVDGTLFPYLDVSSNLTSSTKLKNPCKKITGIYFFKMNGYAGADEDPSIESISGSSWKRITNSLVATLIFD